MYLYILKENKGSFKIKTANKKISFLAIKK
jgi:hypothetical protein